jgi:glycerol-3-phosphate dehydrogenase subunit C
VKKAEPDAYASDCPMAGHHISAGLADGSSTQHPISLLRQAYGI